MSVIVAPEKGRVLEAFGEEITILLSGEQTGSRQLMWLETTPPGEGRLSISTSTTMKPSMLSKAGSLSSRTPNGRRLAPGGSAFVPRGELHTFKNVGDQPSRMLLSTAPAGFEVFFSRCAEEWARPGGPEMGRIFAIAAEHGIHFVKK